MAPDTVSLRYFLVLAQELNFTRAADRIGIAQPALSARMRRLEAELGTALLVRNTRSVVLTTAGAALADSAPPALAALDRAWDTARRAGAGELGTLRIGYSLNTGAETAPALVEELIRSSPGLEIGAVPMATPEISPAVADGRIDAGITRGEQPGRGVRRFLLRRERVGVQLSQHHPLAEHPEIAIADAAAYPLRPPDVIEVESPEGEAELGAQPVECLRVTEDRFSAAVLIEGIHIAELRDEAGVDSGDVSGEGERCLHMLVGTGVGGPRFGDTVGHENEIRIGLVLDQPDIGDRHQTATAGGDRL
ncbi:LysR family transcriptional regulator [Nocardia sp. NPDC052254]|uniref:LysR family transcriptional regulator n=1 Tax=Nocardia sp. NPDC052254 TaxID=3155681 RepID=UPI00341BCFA3